MAVTIERIVWEESELSLSQLASRAALTCAVETFDANDSTHVQQDVSHKQQ